jgi:hypothetical protein
MSEIQGVSEWDTSAGWHTLRIHYTAHPDKANPNWVVKAKAAMPTDRWEREMEINFLRAEGTPVFSDFSDTTHIKLLQFNPYRPLLRGWDFGRNRPRVVIAQRDTQDRLCILREITATNVVVQTFVQKVLSICNEEYRPLSRDVNSDVPVVWEDYADPAGYQKSDKDVRCSIEVLNGFGIYPIAKEHSIERGINIIAYLLLKRKDGTPGLYLNSVNCELLKEAFMGGYVRGEDGKPIKDMIYEDVMDALRYIVLNCFTIQETVPTDTSYEEDDLVDEIYRFDPTTGFVQGR